MEYFVYVTIALKFIVGISILNVWLVQPKKATKWRGGDATTIFEEFEAYGLSKNLCYLVGFLKVTLAVLLLASIKFEVLALPASLGLAALLLGSVIMHFKIKDPLYKSYPAFIFLVMNLVIAYTAY